MIYISPLNITDFLIKIREIVSLNQEVMFSPGLICLFDYAKKEWTD